MLTPEEEFNLYHKIVCLESDKERLEREIGGLKYLLDISDEQTGKSQRKLAELYLVKERLKKVLKRYNELCIRYHDKDEDISNSFGYANDILADEFKDILEE